jgi:hypothetical protein
MTEPFTPIPNWIIDTVPLTNAELAFFARLSRFRINKNGHPHQGHGFPTRKQLEGATGLSARRVNEMLKVMVDKKLLVRADHEERWVLEFTRADEPPDRAGEPPGQAGEPLGTPISDQEEEEGSTAAAVSRSQRSSAQPPSFETVWNAATVPDLKGESWLTAWVERFKAVDGLQGRPSIRETVEAAMEWQHAKKSNWKKNQKTFLTNWLAKTNRDFWFQYQRGVERKGGGYEPVATEQPAFTGTDFADPRFDEGES